MISGTLKIAGIILAAGSSRRMGRVKALLPWGDSLLLEKVIDSASQSRLDSVMVVLGHEADVIKEKIDFNGVRVTVNSDYETGQSSSLRASLCALDDDTDAAMFLLGDQPFISVQVIDKLIRTFCRHPSGLLIPTHGGKRGNPVLVHKSIFEMIHKITGDTGARALFDSLGGQITEIKVLDPGILLDIDTPADYQKLVPLSGMSKSPHF